MRGTSALATACLVALAMLAPTAARADHHFVVISEIFPGSTAAGANAEFVELQMYSGGQNNFAPASSLEFFGPTGNSLGSQAVGDVASGASQRSALVASDEAETAFSVAGDTDLATDSGLMSPTAGAVCFKSTVFGTIDCVAWGAITGAPPSAGTPAAAIPDGSSLERSISGGCPTLLQASDDADDSAADFSPNASPSPRPNSVTPTEAPCTTPSFTINGPNRTRDRTPTFRFAPSEPVTDVACKVDAAAFAPCSSPFTTRRLKPGRHTLRVRGAATDDGTVGTSSKSFKVKRKRR